MDTKGVRRGVIAPALAVACGVGGTMDEAQALLAYGSLSNFDVYNETSSPLYGFEIELEDLAKSAVFGTYPNRYKTSVTQQVDPATSKVTTVVRYAASYVGGSFDYSTAPHVGDAVATNGHTCISVGGCEHFGVAYAGSPSATRYHWLAEDPANPGTLIAGPIVSLGAPIWNVIPAADPARPPEVRVVVPAPEFEPPEVGERKADAVWVKVFKTEVEDEVRLEDLASGAPVINDAETETEWELLEDGKQMDQQDDALEGSKQVIRRYEFYKYSGSVDAENEPLCLFEGCSEPNLDPLAGPIELGDLIGAQMGAVNLDLMNVPVPLPASLPLLAAGLAAIGVARRRTQAGSAGARPMRAP